MLTSLVVKNYALIKDLEIDFQTGFSIITGETGAGKSILLGALSLLLGQRADTTVLSIPEQKCIVEGNFQITAYNLEAMFKDFEIDYDENTIIRREINSNGKSRAFINDTPVNLRVLKVLGEKLVDIHSQHETLELSTDDFQLEVVDTYAENGMILSKFREEYHQLTSLQREYEQLIVQTEKYKEEKDFLQFQFDELEALKLKEGEEVELDEELEKLSHAEEIKLNLGQTTETFSGEHLNTLAQLKNAISLIEKTSKFLPEMVDVYKRLDSVYLELKDIAHEVEFAAESVNIDPHQLEYVRDRLDSINRLLLKYQVSTTKELLRIKADVQEKLANLEDADFHKEEKMKAIDRQQQIVDSIANEIDDQRIAAIPGIEKFVNTHLKQLGMPNGTFKVELTKHEKFNLFGKSGIKFLFSANSGNDAKELSKIASGGELSRLMLSLKALMAEKVKMPTIVFDEIDSGVSGEVADKVGNIIRQMSENRQVFNITHLPQVASKGQYHYKVYKENLNGQINSRIKRLTLDERRTEIAQMLSGENLSEAAYRNADELLNRNQ